MVAETAVLLFVGPHRLAFPHFVSATDVRAVLLHPVHKIAMDSEEIAVEAYGILILRGEEAFAETKVIDGVEQVGFAAAVLAHNAVDILAEVELGILVALEVGKGDMLEIHCLTTGLVRFGSYNLQRY